MPPDEDSQVPVYRVDQCMQLAPSAQELPAAGRTQDRCLWKNFTCKWTRAVQSCVWGRLCVCIWSPWGKPVSGRQEQAWLPEPVQRRLSWVSSESALLLLPLVTVSVREECLLSFCVVPAGGTEHVGSSLQEAEGQC